MLACTAWTLSARAAVDADAIRKSVFKIHVTFQRPDYAIPWQGGAPSRGTGSGFYIGKRRILTNAHVVSNARFIQVQRDRDPRRYAARVIHFAHDCDIAMMTVDDPDFFKDATPVEFADALPNLNDEVTVFGYPMGGDRLSITKGVVSRIDYSTYSHSSVDQHLVIQVDAAINFGNSGGPVLFGDSVIGLAFQGLTSGDNIGYVIPMPVLRHFLADVEDGKYDGYPELGVMTLPTRNAAMRKDLAMGDEITGPVVYSIDPYGSAPGLIEPRDVLTSIDGHDIANDATIELDGNRVVFSEIFERKQRGENVEFEVWRNGAAVNITVPLSEREDPFAYRNIYGERPEYFITGGLVFSPLTREYLKTLGRKFSGANTQQLLYYSGYAKIDGMHEGREEFVVLIKRLPHQVNTYTQTFLNGIVESVNGVAVNRLEDLRSAFDKPTDGFHVIHFVETDEVLILDADSLDRDDPAILARYGIAEREFIKPEETMPDHPATGETP